MRIARHYNVFWFDVRCALECIRCGCLEAQSVEIAPARELRLQRAWRGVPRLLISIMEKVGNRHDVLFFCEIPMYAYGDMADLTRCVCGLVQKFKIKRVRYE